MIACSDDVDPRVDSGLWYSSQRPKWAALALVVLTMSCSNGDSDGGGDDACTPGRSIDCTGPNGCRGYQECNLDGSGYNACVCTVGTGGVSTGGVSTSGVSTGGVSTGGRSTGGRSTGGRSTAGASGSGGDSSEGHAGGVDAAAGEGPGTCEPADMSDWTPPAYVPARPAQSVCTSGEISDYFSGNCHFGGCVEYEPGGALQACGECLGASDLDDAAYGPVIEVTVGVTTSSETNSAGCIELAGQAECAANFQALDACMREACLRTCSPSNTAEYELYRTCKTAARTGPCADYDASAACLLPATSEACGGTDVFAQVANVFCGGG